MGTLQELYEPQATGEGQIGVQSIMFSVVDRIDTFRKCPHIQESVLMSVGCIEATSTIAFHWVPTPHLPLTTCFVM